VWRKLRTGRAIRRGTVRSLDSHECEIGGSVNIPPLIA
jgi:hypothetical protein